jgi:hypothetical protein
MPKASRDTAPDQMALDGYRGAFAALADGYTVGFEAYTEDQDPSALFKGLPNDHCQCPHWGVVLNGRLHYRYEDGSEDVVEAGEAYFARPGHRPLLTAGTEIVEFSPTEDLEKTMTMVMKNLEATTGSA